MVLLAYLWMVSLITGSLASISVREERCFRDSNGKPKCLQKLKEDGQNSNDRRISTLQVEMPRHAVEEVPYFTPLPFAEFMQPHPVYQSKPETVFNVLEREQTVARVLKGGKRVDDETQDETLAEDEKTSGSQVLFRKRKGGRRSERKRRLRKERIERKRARRRERRKMKKLRKRRRRHPKHDVNNNDGDMLKSLNAERNNERRQRTQSSDPYRHHSQNRQQTGENGGHYSDRSLKNNSRRPVLFAATNKAVEETLLPRPISTNQQKSARPYLENKSQLDNVDSDQSNIDDFDRTVDYQISPDYHNNWGDNISQVMDYFSQFDDEQLPTDSSLSVVDSQLLDPSHVTVRRHILRLHNILRSKVKPHAANMLAMSWHGAAATQARNWAGKCMAHRGRDDPNVRWTPRYGVCGQNVFVTRRKKKWAEIIRSWWAEKKFFQFGSTDYRNATYRSRSYTQLVWYSSHKLGCGYSKCTTTSGKTFHRYVCNYCPAGNEPNRLSQPYTEGRACEMCPRACRSVCAGGDCKLCTNRCLFSDLWANCKTLAERWRNWLCFTNNAAGIERFKNCRATCQCSITGDKIV